MQPIDELAFVIRLEAVAAMPRTRRLGGHPRFDFF